MDDFFKNLKLSDMDILASQTDAYIDRILKLMQIIYYAKETDSQALSDKIEKTYRPVLDLLADKMEESVQQYQEKHGEI